MEFIAKIAQQAPNCLLYTSYLIRIAHESSFYESVSAFVPFFWLNLTLMNHLTQLVKPSTKGDYAKLIAWFIFSIFSILFSLYFILFVFKLMTFFLSFLPKKSFCSKVLAQKTSNLLGLIDALSLEVSEEGKHQMRKNFIQSAKLTFMFFEMGITEQRWPV